MKTIIVKTYTRAALNADGQADPAGTWVVAPNSRNLKNQLSKASGIGLLVHYHDGVFVDVYKVAGFHSERRDLVERVTGMEPNCAISIGIRFHLRPTGESTSKLIQRLVAENVKVADIRDCRVVTL